MEHTDPPWITLYAWDTSHALATLYHPYAHEPSALTEYLKQKLQEKHAKWQSHSHPTQVESNILPECNNETCFGHSLTVCMFEWTTIYILEKCTGTMLIMPTHGNKCKCTPSDITETAHSYIPQGELPDTSHPYPHACRVHQATHALPVMLSEPPVQPFLWCWVIWWGWHVWLQFQHWNHQPQAFITGLSHRHRYIISACHSDVQTCSASNLRHRMQMLSLNLIDWILYWMVQLSCWVHYWSLKKCVVYPPQVMRMVTHLVHHLHRTRWASWVAWRRVDNDGHILHHVTYVYHNFIYLMSSLFYLEAPYIMHFQVVRNCQASHWPIII